jgi:hypothetical protein
MTRRRQRRHSHAAAAKHQSRRDPFFGRVGPHRKKREQSEGNMRVANNREDPSHSASFGEDWARGGGGLYVSGPLLVPSTLVYAIHKIWDEEGSCGIQWWFCEILSFKESVNEWGVFFLSYWFMEGKVINNFTRLLFSLSFHQEISWIYMRLISVTCI